MAKKVLMATVISLILVSNLYAGETLTAKSDPNYEKAQVLFQRSIDTGSVEFKKECRKKILELAPESDLGYLSKAWLISIEDSPDLNKAIEYYTKAIELNPKLAFAYYNRGNAYHVLHEYREAIDDFTKAIQLNSKYILVYFFRSFIYDKLGEYQKAIDDLTKAIKLRSGIKTEVAIELGEVASRIKPALLYYRRGQIYEKLNEHKKAKNDFETAKKLDPKWVKKIKESDDLKESVKKTIDEIKELLKYCDQGDSCFALKQYGEAINYYTKAIEIAPGYAVAYYNRGLAYEIQGFLTTACDDFYQAGILYLQQNNRTQALECIDLMKEADPSSPLIKKLMDKIYAEPKKKK